MAQNREPLRSTDVNVMKSEGSGSGSSQQSQKDQVIIQGFSLFKTE